MTDQPKNEAPSEVPGKGPREDPDEMPGEVPGKVPCELPGKGPDEVPGEVPHEVRGKVPREVSDEAPGEVAGKGPRMVPGEVTGEGPGEVPGEVVRVLLVDDEDLVRSGLRMILTTADGIDVVAEARDGQEAITAVLRYQPDVVLMDVRMPGMEGLSALTELSRMPAPPKVIMLTTFDLDDYVHTALRLGAAGFLLKDTAPADLAKAVRTVAAGTAILSPTVTQRLIDAFAEQRPPNAAVTARARLELLTGRETEVVQGVARGLSNAEIAQELAVSEPTVKAHVSHALTKLALANRVQLALLVRDAGGPRP